MGIGSGTCIYVLSKSQYSTKQAILRHSRVRSPLTIFIDRVIFDCATTRLSSDCEQFKKGGWRTDTSAVNSSCEQFNKVQSRAFRFKFRTMPSEASTGVVPPGCVTRSAHRTRIWEFLFIKSPLVCSGFMHPITRAGARTGPSWITKSEPQIRFQRSRKLAGGVSKQGIRSGASLVVVTTFPFGFMDLSTGGVFQVQPGNSWATIPENLRFNFGK
jgi:hypothetical protein